MIGPTDVSVAAGRARKACQITGAVAAASLPRPRVCPRGVLTPARRRTVHGARCRAGRITRPTARRRQCCCRRNLTMID